MPGRRKIVTKKTVERLGIPATEVKKFLGLNTVRKDTFRKYKDSEHAASKSARMEPKEVFDAAEKEILGALGANDAGWKIERSENVLVLLDGNSKKKMVLEYSAIGTGRDSFGKDKKDDTFYLRTHIGGNEEQFYANTAEGLEKIRERIDGLLKTGN